MACDAVLIPQSMATGPDARARTFSLITLAEEVLGVDRAKGEKAYIRPAKPGTADKVFATRSHRDTLLFATTHELAGMPRYRWQDRGDGVEIGTLVPEDDARRDAKVSARDYLAARVKELEAENRRLREMAAAHD